MRDQSLPSVSLTSSSLSSSDNTKTNGEIVGNRQQYGGVGSVGSSVLISSIAIPQLPKLADVINSPSQNEIHELDEATKRRGLGT